MGHALGWLLSDVLLAGRVGLAIGMISGLVAAPPAQTDADLTRHRYVLGTIGSGKSMWLVNMFLGGLQRNHVCVWVSTHGAADVLRYVPEGVSVSYFHPFRGLGVNLLRQYKRTPLERAVLASQCVTVFKRLFPDSMGESMIEHCHAGALALLERGGEATLLDLYRMVADVDPPDTRNPIVAETLHSTEKRTRQASKRRLGRLLTSDILLRALSATGSNALDFSGLINPDKLSLPHAIIADIDQGDIGRENADLLAHVLTSQLEIALSARSGHETMVEVYLDECQTYAHDGLSEAIEEGRKRNVCWTFAHQSREQMPRRLRAALELCGSQYFFTVRPEDSLYASRTINRQEWRRERFVSLPPRIYAAKELVRGKYRVRTARTPTLRPLRPRPVWREPVVEVPAEIATDGVVRHA